MQKTYWILLAIGTVVMIIIMRETGKSLVTPYTPAGIINLELSRSRTNVRNILNIWSSSNGDQTNNIRVAKNNTYLDFLFILFYVPFLYFSSIWATKQFHKRSGWASLGNYVTWFCLIAGALDILENIGMLLSLHEHLNTTTILFTFSCSLLKWLLVAVTLTYLALSLLKKFFVPHKSVPADKKK